MRKPSQRYQRRSVFVAVLSRFLLFQLRTLCCDAFITTQIQHVQFVCPEPHQYPSTLFMTSDKKKETPEVVFRMEKEYASEIPDDVPKIDKDMIEETMNKSEKTLYDILQSKATATRVELKKKYIELAKASHPDAVGNKDGSAEFAEIAAAWRVLGDNKQRKKYDRDLAAKAFSERAQQYANQKLEEAVPAVAAIVDNLAVPFLRRTTATTLAVGQAFSKGVEGVSKASKGDGALSDAFMSAIQAGKDAGRAVDSYELSEKSKELEDRAKAEGKRGVELEKELSDVTRQRLFGTLRSEDFALSSAEAQEVLDRLDYDDSIPASERTLLRKSIEKEIELLQRAESKFSEKLGQYDQTDKEWKNLLQQQEGARSKLGDRRQSENEARTNLENAQRMVNEAKAYLVTTSNALRGVEKRVRKNAIEMDRVTNTLSKKQETVRSALRKKADLVGGGIQVDYVSEDDLTSLRRREIQLMGESQQITRMVARLQSRADKLKVRTDALDRWEAESKGISGAGSSQSSSVAP